MLVCRWLLRPVEAPPTHDLGAARRLPSRQKRVVVVAPRDAIEKARVGGWGASATKASRESDPMCYAIAMRCLVPALTATRGAASMEDGISEEDARGPPGL